VLRQVGLDAGLSEGELDTHTAIVLRGREVAPCATHAWQYRLLRGP
jgi:hypothetical protein